MNFRRVAAWALIFTGLLVYVLAFEKPVVKVQQPAQRGDYEKIFSVNSGTIEAVTITMDGKSAALRRKGLKWQVAAPAGAEAQPEQCESVVQNILDAVVLSIVETNPQNLAQYGLDAPGLVICLNPDDAKKRMTFKLGRKSPSEVSMYGLDVEQRRVVLVGTYLNFSARMFMENIKGMPGK